MIFPLSKKSLTEKYSSIKLNHLFRASTSICPWNKWISKLTCTLKGVSPLKWLLNDPFSSMASVKGSGKIFYHLVPLSHKGFLKKYLDRISFFIISLFLMGGILGHWGRSLSSSISSIPNSRYPNLVGNMHLETKKNKFP